MFAPTAGKPNVRFCVFVVAINLDSRWSCCVDDCFVDDFKVVMRVIERSPTVRCSVENGNVLRWMMHVLRGRGVGWGGRGG